MADRDALFAPVGDAEEAGAIAAADVVVVGAGPGGMAAALAARRAGATVVLLESLDRVGGNAAISTGYVAFVGTDRQRAEGHEDDVDAFLGDLEREVDKHRDRYGIVYQPEIARLFAERSADAYRLLDELGVTFGRFVHRPLQHTNVRLMSLRNTSDFRFRFEEALAAAGVEVVLRTQARRLLLDGGRVRGVEAIRTAEDGRRLRGVVEAGAGVVLAAGGYQASHELRLRYQPERDAARTYYGVPTARGDGHLMGQAVGGDLINMTLIPMRVRAPSRLLEDVISVNLLGVRFHNETGPYEARVEAMAAQPQSTAFHVFDDRVAQGRAELVAELPDPPVSAATLQELARMIGVDAAALTATVAEWNASLESAGAPDRFGRVVFPEPRVGITQPPFHAARMILGASFPAGGFRVTERMEVVGVDGSAVAGLYAAGDCVGAVNVGADLGGIHISSAVTLGLVAGEAAAAKRTTLSADRSV